MTSESFFSPEATGAARSDALGPAPLIAGVKAHRTHHAMKTLIITLSCLVGFSAFAELNKSLLREIGAWKAGPGLHPDMRDRAKNPKSVRTLICYLYYSTVAPSGFDILTYRTAEDLPLEHLRELFRAKGGTHVLRAAGGVYLYHIRSYYDGAP